MLFPSRYLFVYQIFVERWEIEEFPGIFKTSKNCKKKKGKTKFRLTLDLIMVFNRKIEMIC